MILCFISITITTLTELVWGHWIHLNLVSDSAISAKNLLFSQCKPRSVKTNDLDGFAFWPSLWWSSWNQLKWEEDFSTISLDYLDQISFRRAGDTYLAPIDHVWQNGNKWITHEGQKAQPSPILGRQTVGKRPKLLEVFLMMIIALFQMSHSKWQFSLFFFSFLLF